MKSILKINNWREETCDVVPNANPDLYGYFTTMSNTVAVNRDNKEMKWLKYLDFEAEWNVEAMEANFNGLYLPNSEAVEKVNFLKNLVESSRNFINVNEADVVTYSNVLSTLMNTPFEMDGNKNDWELEATVADQNKIYLVHIPKVHIYDNVRSSVYDIHCYHRHLPPPPDYHRMLEKHCDKLKQYLFVRWPIDHYRNVFSNLDRKFYETYRLNLGSNKILYAADLPGIYSYEQVSNLDELKSAEHIMCDTFYSDTLTRETVNYNPLWWSKSYLINANQCLIGVCDKTNDTMTEIMQFNTDKFTNTTMYENLWSPKASWKFLDTFLTFVKDEVGRVTSDRKQFIWKFKIIDDANPHITCEPKFVDVKTGNESFVKTEHFITLDRENFAY
ncbi:hypothetical protein O3M35_001060 [Rhynocoris fuscipes]|uniref:Decapping nuclease n=1 Tax=Rhynocoris fuscipes TaxID=488301 RepID=A0AAW1DST7_9HEMI